MFTSRTWIIVALAALGGACGKKSSEKNEPAPSGATATAGTAAATAAPATGGGAATAATSAGGSAAASGPGVEAGGVVRSAEDGPAAVITAATGTVEVRRVGELDMSPAAADTELHVGDVVRTGDASSATITLADETVVEVAEVSTVSIGSRAGTADPASSSAVLSGLARFTVSPRAPGEGPFRVYTSAGVVVTRGTVYAIGVAASGEARVGVESGSVEVVGLADVSAEPVAVEAGHAASLEAAGTVAAPAAWTADDWGTWRAESDAELEASAAVSAHSAALADLEAQLNAAYADLEASAAAAAEFEAKAATAAEANATAEYETASANGAADIEASFGIASNIEALTWAYSSRATLAADVYARHPDAVQAQWQVVAPRVDAAVLWPKRFEVTAVAYLEPLRVQYYVHHPRGRAHASLVGVTVPPFYASAAVADPEPVAVRARAKTRIYIAPAVAVKAQARPVWIGTPPPGWRAKVKVKAAPVRARVGWYVRPPDAKASLLVGVPVKMQVKHGLAVGAPRPRADLGGGWKTRVGGRVQVGPPDLAGAAKARMKVKVGAGGVLVRPAVVRAVPPPSAADVQAKIDAAARVKGDIKAPPPPAVDVKGAAGAHVGGHMDGHAHGKGEVIKPDRVKPDRRAPGAGAGASGDADVKIKLKVPAPPPPPKVEVKGKVDAKAKLKIGG